MEGYFQQERNLALVVQLVDMRHPPTKDDLHMIEFLCDGGFPFLVALTKSDKLNQTERRQRLAALEEAFSDYEGLRLIPFSSVTGEGVEELREILSSVAEEPEELG